MGADPHRPYTGLPVASSSQGPFTAYHISRSLHHLSCTGIKLDRPMQWHAVPWRVRPLSIMTLRAMCMIERWDAPHGVQYWVVCRSDSESSGDEESLLSTTAPAPLHLLSTYTSHFSTNTCSSSSHSTDSWGMSCSSQGGPVEERHL